VARTPLIDVLRRAAVIARHARATGEPLDEASARERELRVDSARRRFLRQSAIATTALLNIMTDNIHNLTRSDDVVIVGAAYQLVSYDGIRRALEPATQYTMIGGGAHFLKELEAILDRRAAAAT